MVAFQSQTIQPASVTPASERPDAELKNVTLSFDGNDGPTTILDDFSLRCGDGEFVVLIGRSGCGKTTVLNLLAGLVDASSGEVSVVGKAPRSARRHLAYMFARDALIPSRTAIGNVEIGLEVRGKPKAERRRIASDLIAKVGLRGAENRYPWQLSQGMRQRVALARTWALEPDLILMDEPFAALDAQTRETVRAEFLDMWERNRSGVVFVTHDLTEALLVGDRVVVMGPGGKIVGEFVLPFPRPRNPHELPFTSEFRLLERKLHGLLYE